MTADAWHPRVSLSPHGQAFNYFCFAINTAEQESSRKASLDSLECLVVCSASEVRLLDADKTQIGIITMKEALKMATEKVRYINAEKL